MKHLLLILPLLAVAAWGQGVIDLHSHIIPQEMLSALQREDRLMDEGFPLPRYDADSHLRWMDEAGVQTAVITLAAPQPASAAVVRQTNETAARIKKEHSGRFLFCAALPLPDVGAAIREMILHGNAERLLNLTPNSSLQTPHSSLPQSLIVRIAEIEVYPQYLQEYLAYANEVDRLSVEREPGVVCLFPM